MKIPVLFRKRLIPDECIELKDDVIMHCDEKIIVTSWRALRPKPDLDHGFSAYFLDKGIKVSRFLRADNSLLYWYCDIVRYDFNEDHSLLTITDLLADVLIYPDGYTKVVDLDELADAASRSLLSSEELYGVLRRTNDLLCSIYNGTFKDLQALIKDL